MALLTYTLLRVALVVGAGGLLYLLGVRSWLLVVLAVVIGAALSYVLLPQARQAAAGDLERRSGGRPTRVERSVDRAGAEEDAQFDIDPEEYASVVDDDALAPQDKGAAPQNGGAGAQNGGAGAQNGGAGAQEENPAADDDGDSRDPVR